MKTLGASHQSFNKVIVTFSTLGVSVLTKCWMSVILRQECCHDTNGLYCHRFCHRFPVSLVVCLAKVLLEWLRLGPKHQSSVMQCPS